MRTPEVEAAMAWAVLAYNGDTIGEAAAELLRSLATPDIDQFSDNTERQHDGALRTLAAEVERLEAEHIEAMAAISAASRAAGQERTRAEAAEARVKELEREAADSAEEWAFCGLGVGSAAAAAMKHMEILKKYREQNARLRAALEWWRELRDESKGVAGYHLNGAIAEWGEFEDPTDAALNGEEASK